MKNTNANNIVDNHPKTRMVRKPIKMVTMTRRLDRNNLTRRRAALVNGHRVVTNTRSHRNGNFQHRTTSSGKKNGIPMKSVLNRMKAKLVVSKNGTSTRRTLGKRTGTTTTVVAKSGANNGSSAKGNNGIANHHTGGKTERQGSVTRQTSVEKQVTMKNNVNNKCIASPNKIGNQVRLSRTSSTSSNRNAQRSHSNELDRLLQDEGTVRLLTDAFKEQQQQANDFVVGDVTIKSEMNKDGIGNSVQGSDKKVVHNSVGAVVQTSKRKFKGVITSTVVKRRSTEQAKCWLRDRRKPTQKPEASATKPTKLKPKTPVTTAVKAEPTKPVSNSLQNNVSVPNSTKLDVQHVPIKSSSSSTMTQPKPIRPPVTASKAIISDSESSDESDTTDSDKPLFLKPKPVAPPANTQPLPSLDLQIRDDGVAYITLLDRILCKSYANIVEINGSTNGNLAMTSMGSGQMKKPTPVLLPFGLCQRNLRILNSFLQSLKTNTRVAAIVLQSNSTRWWCQGVDLGPMTNRKNFSIASKAAGKEIEQLMSTIAEVSTRKPLIAAINGDTVNFGVLLALRCPFIFASDCAVFRFNYAEVGTGPEVSISCGRDHHCGHACPVERALSEMMYVSGWKTATEMAHRGLITEVLWPGKFKEELAVRVGRIVTNWHKIKNHSHSDAPLGSQTK